MDHRVQAHPRRRMLRPLAALLTTMALFLVPWVDSASAHGSVINPASRVYGCYQRWGNDHLNPNMRTQDPMCYQAWQANANAMWNWNGLYRNGVGGNHQGAVPNGQLCSGGHAEGGRYNAMDAVGDWKTTTISSNFTIQLYDQASHGADYFRVYITKPGFNPVTSALTWNDMQLVTTTGRYGQSQNYSINVNAGSRSGRAVVYTIWQASHMDQAYYICSDVVFS